MIAEGLKRAVLQAAIQGKLTNQLPEDGDAHDLLQEIKVEKKRLIKEGKIKKAKSLPEITEDEIPFDIPDNWCWVRLGEISFNRGQKKPNKEFTYIDISSIDNRKSELGDLSNVLLPENAPSRARKLVNLGDVIYATVRPYLHNICMIDRIIDPEPIVSTGFAVISSINEIINNFLFWCFLTPMFDNYANDNENAKGVAYPAINTRKFLNAIIPLPPLSEQERINNNLEKILLEIENLSVDEKKLDALQESFPGQMKSSILQAAIQGKLTEHLPEDGDSTDLLREIKAEKERLIKEGKIKKEKPLPEIYEEEIPFDIPDNWVWCRLGDVTNYGFGRQVSKEKIPFCVWILELEDIEKERFILRQKKFDRKPGSSKNKFSKGEVLYGKLRPYLKKVIIADEEGFCTTEVIPFKSYGDWIIPPYLKYFLVSPSTDYLINQITHGMDMPRLGTNKARMLLIPLPPHAEQKRIVAHLEELLPLCDTLE